MTKHEIELATALASCTFLPGISHKRFARNMADAARNLPDQEISLRARHYMEILAWRYRRQMPAHLVPERKPLDLPPAQKPPRKPRKGVATASSDNEQPRLI